MKKILFLCILSSFAFAGGKVRIWDSGGDDLDLKAKVMTTNKVTLSSSTATEIEPANTSRKKIEVKNITGGTYEVGICTYAATSLSKCFILNKKDSFGSIYKDEGIQCYTGAIYGLGAAGISTSSVVCIETQ